MAPFARVDVSAIFRQTYGKVVATNYHSVSTPAVSDAFGPTELPRALTSTRSTRLGMMRNRPCPRVFTPSVEERGVSASQPHLAIDPDLPKPDSEAVSDGRPNGGDMTRVRAMDPNLV